VQRGPVGTFSYVIGEGDIVSAKPVTVTQQNETEAVIASGLSVGDRVVTTGFANLSDGAKIMVGRDDQTPSADLAPRKRSRGPQGKNGQGKDGQTKDLNKDSPSRDGLNKDGQVRDDQGKDWQGKGERRRHREQTRSEGDSKGPDGTAQGSEQSGGGAKSQP